MAVTGVSASSVRGTPSRDTIAGNDLVRYSRAGDKFHYRWAARRCLRMIDPRTGPHCITIEGSKESQSAGEFVIDVAEYTVLPSDGESVVYYQLKHSTTRTRRPFSLSELQGTLGGFASRFIAPAAKNEAPLEFRSFRFVSNRPVSPRLKGAVTSIAQGGKVAAKFLQDLERVTRLKGDQLQAFCAVLMFADDEGDYIVQKQKLRGEVAQYLAGFVDSQEAAELVALVEDRALPTSEDGRVGGRIVREDVLQRLGVNSERDLFPAAPVLEPLANVIPREQHDQLVRSVLNATRPLIIHAEGGVGKSVVARQIAASLPEGSLGLIYDCFGAGKYRNESEPRHRPCDAFVQLANELAARGLSRALVGSASSPRDALFRDFLARLTEACVSLQEIKPDARLVLLIDAADNAEMAATENGDACFASPLLRETLPAACRLVVLCRTERIALLKPPTTVRRLELKPFSLAETKAHLRGHYPRASGHDVDEFHRLTGGNPRVQANAMMGPQLPLTDLLSTLGPTRTTVDEQIADQLDAAIGAIHDQHTSVASAQVESICRGLANLPPFIPLPVLAAAAGVDIAAIKSLVSDLGRPLWHSDDSVQFRDEPTETWFRTRFGAAPEAIAAYADALEPLAKTYTYVAKALPKLWLRAGDHDRLIALALSEDHLPADNAIDARDIRVYRLQFAFKAALKVGRLTDAAKLALRAGEEMAGNQRQLELLAGNTDLVALLQESHRIQEYAYKKLLAGAWQGSENVYSAALLSAVRDFKGEARGYLRVASRWLQIYFEERDRQRKKQPHVQDKLKIDDIVEMACSHLNLFGPQGVVKFLLSWRPRRVVFDATMKLCDRLVDAARYDEINEIALRGQRNPYLIVAIAAQLNSVARFPPRACLVRTLDVLARRKPAIEKPERYTYGDELTPSILGFAEACAHHRCAKRKIHAVVEHFVEAKASLSLTSDYQEDARRTFFRATALKLALKVLPEPEPKALMSSPPADQKQSRSLNATEERNMEQTIGAMLPWFVARADLIARNRRPCDLTSIAKRSEAAAAGRNERFDPIPREVAYLHFELLSFNLEASPAELDDFTQRYLTRSDSDFILRDRLRATRVSQRRSHLASLCARLEEFAAAGIEGAHAESPEERSGWYVRLARAVLPGNRADAAAYFECAVEAVSKFGDEMVERWDSVVAIARRAAEQGPRAPEVMHRFVRCAEMIGDMVVREKYWCRDDVFRVGQQLDPAGALGALSRWREREVGRFDEQIETLAVELGRRQILPPAVAWSFSGFVGCNASIDLLKACLAGESSLARRQRIFDQALRDFSLDDKLVRCAEDLTETAREFGIDASQLPVSSEKTEAPVTIARDASLRTTTPRRKTSSPFQKYLRGIDVLSTDGMSQAMHRFDALPYPKNYHGFWSEILARVPAGREVDFLRMIPGVPRLDYYDMNRILGALRECWAKKVAVRKAWPAFLRSLGRRFFAAIARRYNVRHWYDDEPMVTDEVENLRAGMLEALPESTELVSAGTFFGFVGTIAARLSPDQANAVLDFGLHRFELHIEPEFADGPWAEWLRPPAEIHDAFTGMIWSALGAPPAGMRWQAAHCVLRLAQGGCQREIDSLVGWFDRSDIGPFGVRGFPFYQLHAQLYLLIAFARAATDETSCLLPHASWLVRIALHGLPHVLLRKYAARTALTIERDRPGTLDPDHVARLHEVGESILERRRVDRDITLSTPWHERGEVQDLKFHFAWDFDRYWFEPLGRVFGIRPREVMDLAREAAVRFVGVDQKEEFPADGRNKLWAGQHSYPYGTSHDHGTYPAVDDYSFYYSYHAMHITAGRLLADVPVVEHADRDYEEDRWRDWLRDHDLARSDGKWLFDRRDPAPTARRPWTTVKEWEHWLWRVGKGDFLDVIANYNPLPRSLCVNGDWTDCGDHQWVEEVNVTSAWVRPEVATSLAQALRACDNAYQARVPSDDQRDQNDVEPFDLLAWIKVRGGTEFRLDRSDPYAKQIVYPPTVLGESIVRQWQLQSDPEQRKWYQPGSVEPVAHVEVWSEEVPDPHERTYRGGARVVVTLELLRQMSETLNRHLVLVVAIRRHEHSSYRSTSREYRCYVPSSHKVFILTSDGILQDAIESHKLG